MIGASSALLHYLCCITDPCPVCLWSTPAECLQSQIIVLKLLLIVSLSALNMQHICAPGKLIRSCLHVVESGPRRHLPWWFHLPAEYTHVTQSWCLPSTLLILIINMMTLEHLLWLEMVSLCCTAWKVVKQRCCQLFDTVGADVNQREKQRLASKH